MVSQLTRTTTNDKPEKPYPDFPLFAHATGRWAKKIRGKMHYFGPWRDPDGAVQKYQKERDDLYAGRRPRLASDGLTVRDLCNRFLTAKKHLLDAGEITGRTFHLYHATCEGLIREFSKERLVSDLTVEDFEKLRANLAKTRGPLTLGNEVMRCRTVFKYCFDAGLTEKPIRYGPTFKRPSKKVLRQARHKRGERMLEAKQICKMLDLARPQLKAMVLLGINCGFGNADVSNLPQSALDLKGGWVNFPRPKTAIRRRVPLWRETIDALRIAIKQRPEPKRDEHAGLVFLTRNGQKWSSDSKAVNLVTAECRKLLTRIGITTTGLNFYALRHTFETIGGEARDQVAVDAIMGHSPDTNDMASVYRERISDDRLRAVTDHVRKWLFGSKNRRQST